MENRVITDEIKKKISTKLTKQENYFLCKDCNRLIFKNKTGYCKDCIKKHLTDFYTEESKQKLRNAG